MNVLAAVGIQIVGEHMMKTTASLSGKLRFLLLIFLLSSLLAITQSAKGQITSLGTDFWVAYGDFYDSTAAVYELYISSDVATTGTVSVSNSGANFPFTVPAGGVATVNIPSADAIPSDNPGTIESKSLHIVSNDPVAVFAATIHFKRTEATLCLPTPSIGTNYMIVTDSTDTKWGEVMHSNFVVVAGATATNVQITPVCNTSAGNTAGVPFTVNLGPGQTYCVRGANLLDDLTGTIVSSTSGTPFTVFAAHECTYMGCPNGNGTPGSVDPLYEIMYPLDKMGVDHILVPSVVPANNILNDQYKVVATQANTQVFENGTLVTTLLNVGDQYMANFTAPVLITGNKPISVAKFMESSSCITGGSPSDPAMTIISPNKFMYLDTITFFASPGFNINTHYVDIVTRTPDANTVYIDGVLQTGFVPLPADPNYSYLQGKIITGGSHSITTTGCGFLAYSWGRGNFESYAYSAGLLFEIGELNVVNSNQSDTTMTVYCEGHSAMLICQVEGGIQDIAWDYGDGNISNGLDDTVYHTYMDTGVYYIQSIATYSCRIDTAYDTLYVFPLPEVDIGNDTIFCEGPTITLDATLNGMQYLWNTGDLTPTLTVSTTGVYNVQLTDPNGCIGYDTIDVTVNPYPFVDLGSDTTICAGESLTMDLTGIGQNYVWSDNSTNPALTVSTDGTYWVDVDSLGCVSSDTLILTTSPLPIVDLGNDTTICSGATLLLDATQANMQYLWNTGDITPTLSVSTTGDYDVQLINVDGCIGYDTINVLFAPGVSVDFTFNTVCEGDSTNFVDNSISQQGTIIVWDWDFGDGFIGNAQDPSHSYGTSGTYNVSLTVQTADGCLADTTLAVDVIPVPNAGFTFNIPCEGGTTVFNDITSGSTPTGWLWNFGDTTVTSSTQNPQHTYDEAGNYTVTLIVNPGGMCADTAIAGVIVLDNPLSDLTVDITSGCAPVCVVFDDLSTIAGAQNITTWAWDFGDGTTATQPDPSHCYNLSGTYDVSLSVVTDSGCTATYTASQLITVFTNPTAGFDANPNPVDNSNPVVNFTDLSSSDAILWDWSFYNQNSDQIGQSSDQHPSFNFPDDPGTYPVLLEVTTANGCIDSIWYYVEIEASTTLYVPNAFTPDNDGLNDIFLPIGTGWKTDEFELNIYNRWGENIFVSYNMEVGWDGRFKGSDVVQTDVYVWTVAGVDLNGDKHEYTGHVTLIK